MPTHSWGFDRRVRLAGWKWLISQQTHPDTVMHICWGVEKNALVQTEIFWGVHIQQILFKYTKHEFSWVVIGTEHQKSYSVTSSDILTKIVAHVYLGQSDINLFQIQLLEGFFICFFTLWASRAGYWQWLHLLNRNEQRSSDSSFSRCNWLTDRHSDIPRETSELQFFSVFTSC